MKRFFVPLCLLLAWTVAAGPAATPATVQIKEASLYAKPTATGKFLGKIPYGTKIAVVVTKDDWAQIEVEGQSLTGWLRTQAFTTKKLDLKSGKDSAAVSSTEVSLAGRGFTEEVESEYKQGRPGLDFLTLDLMEAQGLTPDELDTFLREGGLKPGDRP